MATVSVTFSGASLGDVAGAAQEWLAAIGVRVDAPQQPDRAAPEPPAGVSRVLAGVRGAKSRRLLRLLAKAGVEGRSVELTPALVEQFGAVSGTAFSGMIGPVNRRAQSLLGRPIIVYPSTDSQTIEWRIAPETARAVLDLLGEEGD